MDTRSLSSKGKMIDIGQMIDKYTIDFKRLVNHDGYIKAQ